MITKFAESLVFGDFPVRHYENSNLRVPQTNMDLGAMIFVFVGDVREISGIFANVHKSYIARLKRAFLLTEDLLSNLFEQVY